MFSDARTKCAFCRKSYIYASAYFTHLRDKHAERVQYVPQELLPDAGFCMQEDYVLLPDVPRFAVLPPDSDSDEYMAPHDAGSEWENDDEVEQPDSRDDPEQPPIPHPTEPRVETLAEKEPGKILDDSVPPPDEQILQEDEWAPFENEKEYRFAEWVVKHRISKTAVDELLKSTTFTGNHTFTSAYSLFKKLDGLTYELGMHTWKSGKVCFTRPDASNVATNLRFTQFFYRNPITCIEFLLRQTAYKEHMTYAPLKVYNEMNERVYSELYTGDWWWKVQVSLSTRSNESY
jgi:hypothetical protein